MQMEKKWSTAKKKKKKNQHYDFGLVPIYNDYAKFGHFKHEFDVSKGQRAVLFVTKDLYKKLREECIIIRDLTNQILC